MVRRSASFFVILLVIGFIAAACAGGSSDDGSAAAQGGPDFEAQLLSGGEFRSADLQGENTVYWFWAAWCTRCRREAPALSAAASKFPGLNFVGVPGLSAQSPMEEFVAEFELGGFDHVVDENGSIWASFGIPAQPAYAFVDRQGNIETVLGELGYEGLVSKLEELVAT